MQTEQELSYDVFYKEKFITFVAYCCSRFEINEPDAEDMVAEAFDLLWKNWDEIQPHDSKSLSLWMYSTLHKKRKNYFRLRRHNNISYEDYIMTNRTKIEMTSYIDDINERDEYELFVKYLAEIEASLTEDNAKLFHMIVVEKRDAEYIATQLNCKPQNTYLKWHRLKRKLKKIIPQIIKTDVLEKNL